MGISYEWHNDIPILTITAPWTWEDFHRVGQSMMDAIAQVDDSVANIIDVTRMGSIPTNNPLRHLQKAAQAAPPNLYLTVLVGAPYIVTVFMDVLFRIQPERKHKITFTKTLDVAVTLIGERKAERLSDG